MIYLSREQSNNIIHKYFYTFGEKLLLYGLTYTILVISVNNSHSGVANGQDHNIIVVGQAIVKHNHLTLNI